MKMRAVFFDRDDTLMVNVPYLGDPTKVEIFADAAEALFALRKAGFLLFVVSNQSGVGRGLITREQVHAVNAEMKRQFDGDYIHAFYHSFATPDDPYATDRKPSPELLQEAAKAHNLDLAGLVFYRRPADRYRMRDHRGLPDGVADAREVEPADEVDPDDLIARAKAHYVTATLSDASNWIMSVSSSTPNLKTHELE